MTKIFLFILFIAGSVTAQAGSPDKGKTLKVKTDESTVKWTGRKITGEHSGTVAIKEGSLTLKDGILKGGSVILDMTTITVVNKDGSGNPKLDGHLKSDDFFGTETYPTATLIVTNVESKGNGRYHLTADLTIKGITNPVQFDAQLKNDTKEVIATAELKVDRTLYNVRYGSGKFFDGIGDKAISDDFDLAVKLVAAYK